MVNNSLEAYSRTLKTAAEQWAALSPSLTEVLSQKASSDERIKSLQQELSRALKQNADLGARNQALEGKVANLEAANKALETENKANAAAAKAFKAISAIAEQVQRNEVIEVVVQPPARSAAMEPVDLTDIEKYRKKLAANPNDPQLHFKLGSAYFKIKGYQEAAKNFLKATTLDPRNWANWYYLAKANIQLRDDSQIEAHIAKAIECDPKQGEIYHLKSQYLRSRGNIRDADVALEKARTLGVKV